MVFKDPINKFRTSNYAKKTRNEYYHGAPKNCAVGTMFESRDALSRAGVHGPTQAGIHNNTKGAYSVVLSGGYDDDEDHGEWFIYSGKGGRGEKGYGPLTTDQKWTDAANKSLQMSFIHRKSVRVIRGRIPESPYAPVSGLRYDGLYTVVKVYSEIGKSGHKVCKAVLQRKRDQAPLPAPRWLVAGSSSTASRDEPDESDSDSDNEEEPISPATPVVAPPAFPVAPFSSVTNNISCKQEQNLVDDDLLIQPTCDDTCTLPEKALFGKKKLQNMPKIEKKHG